MAIYQGGPEFDYHSNENSHFGKPELISKLREVGRLFAERYPGKRIWINDMSLPLGGTFKTEQQLTRGHSRHKSGEDADISFKILDNKEQRLALDEIIGNVFRTGGHIFHGGPTGWHWHVSTGRYLSKNTSIVEGFVEYFTGKVKRKGDREKAVKFIKDYGFLEEFLDKLSTVRFDSYFKNKREAKVKKNIDDILRP